jgi:hypothetical protein
MAHTACLVCLISTVSGCSKKAKNAVLVAGTQQKFEQSISLDIYGMNRQLTNSQPCSHFVFWLTF